jgi:hypothetical protein
MSAEKRCSLLIKREICSNLRTLCKSGIYFQEKL